MRRTRSQFAAALALALILTPTIVEARAGGGSSMGSRGSMTFSAPPSTNTAPYAAQPMQRSMTQPSPGFQSPRYAAPAYGQRPGSSFTSGLMGGLIGAGLGGLLLGHGFFGGGLGFGGLIGFLLQIFLLVLLVRFLIRRFTGGRQPAFAGGLGAGGPGIFGRTAAAANPFGSKQMGANQMGVGGGRSQVAVIPADFNQFENLLTNIQAAWSRHDLNALQTMTTPEMASYFAEQLSDQVSRGVRNLVTDIRLISGDLSQAWAEQGREYATVAMRFSMIDVTRDVSGRVMDGSPTEHVTATELWTFVRSRGGHWILSAIQQAR